MLIDDFIMKIKNGNFVQTARGGNKKVFLFDEYVLLYGNFKENDLKQEIIIGNNLKKTGVSIIPTLQYHIEDMADNNEYVTGYTLQPRAMGDCLYRRDMKSEEYKERLKLISQMSLKKFEKFISDWFDITNAGLMIDPSKCENFFYSNDEISFIDLNVRKREYPLKTAFTEILAVLTGLGLMYRETDIYNCMQIIKNIAHIFLKRGLCISDIKDVLIHRFGSIFADKQIDFIIGAISNEYTVKNLSVVSLKNTPKDIRIDR